jgi:predicted PurR-regulated permease PerM
LFAYVATQLTEVLFTVFAGILLAVFLAGVTEELTEDMRLPRPLALLLTLVGVVGIIVGLWMLAGPDISEQVNALAALLPDATERLATRLRNSAQQYEWLRQFVDPTQLLPPVSSVIGRVTNVFRGTINVLVNGFIILFIGIYGAAAPHPYVDGVVRLIPPGYRPRAREILRALGRALRWWLTGRFIMMVIVGVLTAIGLQVAGIPSPVALGLVAALFSFVPYLGPVLSVLPALLVASVLGVTKILYVLVVYGAVQLLESYLIAPLVQQQAVHIPPAAVITAQFIGGIAAGAVGVLLATPLTIVAIVLVQTLYVEDVLGDDVALLGEH